MKKIFTLSLIVTAGLSAFADDITQDWGGVAVIPNVYSQRISQDGSLISGETETGDSFFFNRITQEFYVYSNCVTGQGNVISDNGTLVGHLQLGDGLQDYVAVIMKGGEIIRPSVYDSMVTSNIDAITPDGTRICGVVNPGSGSVPYYADLDSDGNITELKYLPTPERDFYGSRPQFCTASWISNDGKTILGQVVIGNGFFFYPVVYRQTGADGSWELSFPSKPLFNPDNLPIPEPVPDREELYPDEVFPDPTIYMDAEEKAKWEEALDYWGTMNYDEAYSPYNNLGAYGLTQDEIIEYNENVLTYDLNGMEYSRLVNEYNEKMIYIADTSVLFIQSAQSMSPDGKWIAATSEIMVEPSDGLEIEYPWVPYLFNVETGDYRKVGLDNLDLLATQVFPNGDVMCSTPPNGGVLPPISYYYNYQKDKIQTFYSYVSEVNPTYGEWMREYLSNDVQTGETEYEYATITGKVTGSNDLTVVCGGVLASALNYDEMEITYILTGLPAGVEEIIADPDFDGYYKVYNLHGIKLMETKDASSINNLPKGIYIVNGKKIAL